MMPEMIDVLDENGIKTGQIVTRDEVHRKGLWHRCIVVAILNDKNEILLQQRSQEKLTNPGKWDVAAAGHVDAGEDALSTVIRETSEEIGVNIGGGKTALYYDLPKIRYLRVEGRKNDRSSNF